MKKLFIQLGGALVNPNDIAAIVIEPVSNSTHRRITVLGPAANLLSEETSDATFELSEHTYRKLTGAIGERYGTLTIHANGRTDQDRRSDKLNVVKLIYPDKTIIVFPTKLFAVRSTGQMLSFHVEGVEAPLPDIYCSDEPKNLAVFEDFVALKEITA